MSSPAQLLSDAKSLLTYASSRGRVEDMSLFDQIASLEEKLTRGAFTPADEQTLNKIINALSKLVSPASLDEVRADSAITGTAPTVWRQIRSLCARLLPPKVSLPATIFSICIFVILAIIPLTTFFNRLTASIAELRDTEQEDYYAILHDARTLSNSSADDKAKSQQQDQDLQSKIKKLREIQAKINVDTLAINATIDLSLGAPRWLPIIFSAYGIDFSLYTPIKVSPPASSLQASQPSSSSSQATQCADRGEVCQNRLFAESLGIVIGPDDIQGAYFARRQAESAAALLGGSMLPVFYGLLGASVYLLRRFLGEGGQELRPDTAMTAFLRLGLGGVAGLAIGWFWVPTSAKEVAEAGSLTTTPFALAFLAGFSIELLFSLLDRIIAAISPPPANPSQSPRTGNAAGSGEAPNAVNK